MESSTKEVWISYSVQSSAVQGNLLGQQEIPRFDAGLNEDAQKTLSRHLVVNLFVALSSVWKQSGIVICGFPLTKPRSME